jgi:hypothetical protein
MANLSPSEADLKMADAEQAVLSRDKFRRDVERPWFIPSIAFLINITNDASVSRQPIFRSYIFYYW